MGREIKKKIIHGKMHRIFDIKYNIRTVIHDMTHDMNAQRHKLLLHKEYLRLTSIML